MELTLTLPDIRSVSDVIDNYLREMLIANLCHIGKLSEKEASVILGKSRREFGEVLPKLGFSTLGDAHLQALPMKSVFGSRGQDWSVLLG